MIRHKYRIIRRVVEHDGLNEDDADIILAQLPPEKNETLEKEKYPVDDTGNTPWGYGRDPDLYD